MFEQYVRAQAGDPRWRRAMGVAAAVSGSTTSALVVAMVVTHLMNIRRMEPPRSMIDVVQVLTEDWMSPAFPPLPPPPAGNGVGEEDETREEDLADEEIPLEDPAVPLDERPRKQPDGAKRTDGGGVPDGVRHGIPGGKPKGIPGGQIDGHGADVIPRTMGALTNRRAPNEKEDAVVPIQSLRKRALYAPNPPDPEIAKTMAAKVYRRPGSSSVSFCVAESGKVEDVKIVRPFPNDPQIDRLCVEAVKAWRFEPWSVNGRARRACSVVRFDFEFR